MARVLIVHLLRNVEGGLHRLALKEGKVELVRKGARRLVLKLLSAMDGDHMRHAGSDEGLAALVRVARGDEYEVERRPPVLRLGASGHEVREPLHLERVRAAQAVLEG